MDQWPLKCVKTQKFPPRLALVHGWLFRDRNRTGTKPETGTVGAVFFFQKPKDRGTGTIGTVFQEPTLEPSLAVKSGVAPANQTKERGKTKSSRISPIFVNSGVFPWENKHDSHLELLFRNGPVKSS